jgi:predicted enzyme related to lactoylglutathione lyase
MPPFWLVYFAVGDCDQAVATASALGATVMQPPFDIPPGRMAVLADPVGAVFAVLALAAPVA